MSLLRYFGKDKPSSEHSHTAHSAPTAPAAPLVPTTESTPPAVAVSADAMAIARDAAVLNPVVEPPLSSSVLPPATTLMSSPLKPTLPGSAIDHLAPANTSAAADLKSTDRVDGSSARFASQLDTDTVAPLTENSANRGQVFYADAALAVDTRADLEIPSNSVENMMSPSRKRPREENAEDQESEYLDGDSFTAAYHRSSGTAPPRKKKKKMTPEERAAWDQLRKDEKDRKEKEKIEERKKKEELKLAEKRRKDEERNAEKKRKEEEAEAEKRRREEEKQSKLREKEEEKRRKEAEKEQERKRKEEEREMEKKRREDEKELERKKKDEEKLAKQREKEELELERKRKEEEEASKQASLMKSFFTPKKDSAIALAATSPVAPSVAGLSVPTEESSLISYYRAIGPFKAEARCPPEYVLVDYRRPKLRDIVAFETAMLTERSEDTMSNLLSQWKSKRNGQLRSKWEESREKSRRLQYGRVIDLSGTSDDQARRIECLLLRSRNKVLTHHDDVRPPYYGTWTKPFANISARNPWAREPGLDYEEDSGEEWDEEEGEGSDLGDDDEDDGEEERGPNEYELDDDSMVVPDDYFSADEGIDALPERNGDHSSNGAEAEDDEDDDPLLPNLNKKRRENSIDDFTDVVRAKLNREKLLVKTKANLKRKSERNVIQAKISGVLMSIDSAGDDRERKLLSRLSIMTVFPQHTPLAIPLEMWQPLSKLKVSKKRVREGVDQDPSDRPLKKRHMEPFADSLLIQLISAAYGCTSAEKVATDFALKHTEATKKGALRNIKEFLVYEKREGFGLRKRYFPKREVVARFQLDLSSLDAILRANLEREAFEAKQLSTQAAAVNQVPVLMQFIKVNTAPDA